MSMHTATETKGFTLIELLVVIAIIGILASVVLASLNSARAKGADAAVRSNLANIRAQAELVYDSQNPNSYQPVCGNTTVASALTSAGNAGGATPVCSSAQNTYAVSAQLRVQNQFSASSGIDHWCVDSAGSSKVIDNAIGATATACP